MTGSDTSLTDSPSSASVFNDDSLVDADALPSYLSSLSSSVSSSGATGRGSLPDERSLVISEILSLLRSCSSLPSTLSSSRCCCCCCSSSSSGIISGSGSTLSWTRTTSSLSGGGSASDVVMACRVRSSCSSSSAGGQWHIRLPGALFTCNRRLFSPGLFIVGRNSLL